MLLGSSQHNRQPQYFTECKASLILPAHIVTWHNWIIFLPGAHHLHGILFNTDQLRNLPLIRNTDSRVSCRCLYMCAFLPFQHATAERQRSMIKPQKSPVLLRTGTAALSPSSSLSPAAELNHTPRPHSHCHVPLSNYRLISTHLVGSKENYSCCAAMVRAGQF